MDTFLICVKTLRDGVLLHTPSTFNLTSLTVRLTRPDRQNWLYIAPQTIESLVQEATTVPTRVEKGRANTILKMHGRERRTPPS